jgi:hypothetical protein
MTRKFSFGELNLFRRRNRTAFNPSTYNVAKQVSDMSFSNLSPTLNADIDGAFQMEVKGIYGFGPLDPARFPTMFASDLEEYGSDMNNHPIYFQVFVGAREPEPTSVEVLNYSNSLTDNNALNLTYPIAAFKTPHFGGPGGGTPIPFQQGDKVKAVYFNKIQGTEIKIVEKIGAGTSINASALINSNGTFNSTAAANDVSNSDGDPETLETHEARAAQSKLSEARADHELRPLIGDGVNEFADSNETLIRTSVDPQEGGPNTASAGTPEFNDIRARGDGTKRRHKGTDVYYLPGETLYAPVALRVVSTSNRVYSDDNAPERLGAKGDHGNTIVLQPDDFGNSHIMFKVTMMHIRWGPDGMPAVDYVFEAGAPIGYNYYPATGAPDDARNRYAQLSSVNGAPWGPDRMPSDQYGLGHGAYAHIHFEVNQIDVDGASVRILDPAAVLDFSSFRRPDVDGTYNFSEHRLSNVTTDSRFP